MDPIPLNYAKPQPSIELLAIVSLASGIISGPCLVFILLETIGKLGTGAWLVALGAPALSLWICFWTFRKLRRAGSRRPVLLVWAGVICTMAWILAIAGLLLILELSGSLGIPPQSISKTARHTLIARVGRSARWPASSTPGWHIVFPPL